jgi:hypothetical protein
MGWGWAHISHNKISGDEDNISKKGEGESPDNDNTAQNDGMKRASGPKTYRRM